MTTLHPIVVGTPTDAGLPLDIGALVTYHGRRRGHEYSVFYVARVDGGGVHPTYDIVDRDYPAVAELHGVSRQHLTPTGEVVALCPDCGHEAGNPGRGAPVYAKWCEAHCGCDRHETVRDN